MNIQNISLARKSKTALGGTVSLIVLAIATSVASAQDRIEPQLQADQITNTTLDDNRGDVIVVTGSRLRQTNLSSPTPVTVIDSELLESSGENNIGDFLAELPAFSSDGNSQVNSGANFLNLRNLGSQRTLTLVDGRRFVSSSPGSQSVDVNSIPSALTERVEVVTGGASAIYGADAVTGVVNFVLKDDFEGVDVRAQYGTSEDGYQNFNSSITLGSNFDDGRGNAVFSGYYRTNNTIALADRDELLAHVTDGRPRNPLLQSEGGGFEDRFGGNIFVFDQGETRLISPDALDENGDCVDCLVGDDPLFAPIELRPDNDRYGFSGKIQYKLTDFVNLNVEGNYSASETSRSGIPTFNFLVDVFSRGASFRGRTINLINNPFLPDEISAVSPRVAIYGRINSDFPRPVTFSDRQTFRGLIGFDGEIAGDWVFDIAYAYGRSTRNRRFENRRILDNFASSFSPIRDPDTGEIRCDDDAAEGCVPFNIFGGFQPNATAAFDFFLGDIQDSATITQHLVTGHTSGTAFSLPAGDVEVAVGAEYRREFSDFRPPDPQGTTDFGGGSTITGNFDVWEVFGEFSAPILTDQPLAQNLSVDGAVRFADYSTVGGTLSWKVGADWVPFDDLRFRGTYSRAVRAPNINELFNPIDRGFFLFDDPCDVNEIASAPAELQGTIAANCAADGVPADFVSNFNNVSVEGLSGGNPDLEEERANTLTAGFVLTPSAISGLSLTVDYWKIDIDNAIVTQDFESIIGACYRQTSINNLFCNTFSRDAITNEIIDPFNRPENTLALRASGVDFEARYGFELGNGSDLDFRLIGTRAINLEEFDPELNNFNQGVGELGRSKWQFNMDTTWSWNNFSANYGMRWIGPVFGAAVDADTLPPEELADARRAEAVFYHDIRVSYERSDQLEVFAGINNLADRLPPDRIFGSSDSFGVASYDNLGRFFFFGTSLTF